jgi:hypothetical protein
VRTWQGQRLPEDGVDLTEDRRTRADAHRDGQHGDSGESRRFDQQANGKPEILPQTIDPRAPPRLTLVFFDQHRRSDLKAECIPIVLLRVATPQRQPQALVPPGRRILTAATIGEKQHQLTRSPITNEFPPSTRGYAPATAHGHECSPARPGPSKTATTPRRRCRSVRWWAEAGGRL